VKRFSGAFTFRPQYKADYELQIEKKPGPGPQVYTLEEKLVKPTRYSNPLAGGHDKKNGLKVDKNPGPGQYEVPNTLADESKKKAKYSTASKLNNTSMMSQSMSVISSPRECAFSVALMGEPFNPVGFIKPTTTSYGRRDHALLNVP